MIFPVLNGLPLGKVLVRTVKEFIDYAKKNPGLQYGTAGAGTSMHLAGTMFGQRMVDTLNDPVVIDIRTLIKRPLGRKDDQTVEQHTPGGNAFQYPHVARARQHGPPGLITGVRFSCQHSGNRARRHPGPAGDLGYF